MPSPNRGGVHLTASALGADNPRYATDWNVRSILVRKFGKFDYEMVHSGVYLNKYAVNIAPFSTPACHDCCQNIT